MSARGTSPRTQPTARRWRWWHTLLAVVVGSVLVLVILVGLAVASLSNMFAGDIPREDDPEVVAARADASVALQADIDRLTSAVVAPALTSSQPVSHGEEAPPCDVGQHNFKIDDDFDLACRLQHTGVVAAADRSTFRNDMLALDAALRADGWVPSPTFDMHRVLVEYWDALATPPDASPAPGTAPGSGSVTRSYSMDDLPSAQYSATVGGEVRQLAVGWAESESSTMTLTYDEERATFTGADGSRMSAGEVLAAIPAEGYAVVLTQGVEYFRQ